MLEARGDADPLGWFHGVFEGRTDGVVEVVAAVPALVAAGEEREGAAFGQDEMRADVSAEDGVIESALAVVSMVGEGTHAEEHVLFERLPVFAEELGGYSVAGSFAGVAVENPDAGSHFDLADGGREIHIAV